MDNSVCLAKSSSIIVRKSVLSCLACTNLQRVPPEVLSSDFSNPAISSIEKGLFNIMKNIPLCPICSEALVSTSQQLGSDDEPTVLVRSCSKHGQVGSVIQAYNRRLEDLTKGGKSYHKNVDTKEIPYTHVPRECYPCGDNNLLHHAYINIRYRNRAPTKSTPVKYNVIETRCTLGSSRCSGHIYTNYPLWNIHNNTSKSYLLVEVESRVETYVWRVHNVYT